MSGPIIIALSGKLGVGKDYIASNIIAQYFGEFNCAFVGFADHIKVNAAARLKVPISDMYGKKTPEIRKMLQIAGTEEGRDKYGEDIWINTLKNWIDLRYSRDKTRIFIITDCRFKNEARWIESQNGILIRINAPDRNKIKLSEENDTGAISTHPSETDLDDYEFKYIVDNSIKNEPNVVGDVITILAG